MNAITPFIVSAVDVDKRCILIQCPNCGYAAEIGESDIAAPEVDPHSFQGLTGGPCDVAGCGLALEAHAPIDTEHAISRNEEGEIDCCEKHDLEMKAQSGVSGS